MLNRLTFCPVYDFCLLCQKTELLLSVCCFLHSFITAATKAASSSEAEINSSLLLVATEMKLEQNGISALSVEKGWLLGKVAVGIQL